MLSHIRRAWLPAVLVCWAGAVTPVLGQGKGSAAPAFEVRDGGRFFGEEAVRKANREIRLIKETHHKDLKVETFDSVPPAFKELDRKDKEAVNRFFHNLATDLARDARVDGVYVGIWKDEKVGLKR